MPTLYESRRASVAAHRESPDYKPFVDAEHCYLNDAVTFLHDTFQLLQRSTARIVPAMTSDEFANELEVIDARLTIARSHARDVRRAAKAIVARRKREENGVFCP